MPYGTKRRNLPRRTTRPVPRSRRVTTIPAKKRTTRSYVRSNAVTAARNATHINRLYRLRYGSIQRNLQVTLLDPRIGKDNPICFDAADFTCARQSPSSEQLGCQIYQVNALLTGIDPLTNFSVTSAPLQENAFWNHVNQDMIDTGKYLPVAAYYKVLVQGDETISNCRLRVDLFTQKAGFFLNRTAGAGQSIYNRVMPDALIHLRDMCGDNRFNPDFFKHYKTMHAFINSYKEGGTGASHNTSNEKVIRFTVRPKKARYQSKTVPHVPGFVDPLDNDTDRGQHGAFNIDPRTPFWCMISSDDASLNDVRNIKVRITRHVVWRDHVGSSRIV